MRSLEVYQFDAISERRSRCEIPHLLDCNARRPSSSVKVHSALFTTRANGYCSNEGPKRRLQKSCMSRRRSHAPSFSLLVASSLGSLPVGMCMEYEFEQDESGVEAEHRFSPLIFGAQPTDQSRFWTSNQLQTTANYSKVDPQSTDLAVSAHSCYSLGSSFSCLRPR